MSVQRRAERSLRGADGGSPRLFPREQLALRRTGEARLLALASLPARAATARERRDEENRRTMRMLRERGERLAVRFDLGDWRLEKERDRVTEHYGICYEDGLIRIRLRHARTGRLLKESSLVDTLCHELAHLRHLDHGVRFRRLYQRILRQARGWGYYRPGAPATGRPVQGRLFTGEGCGTHGEDRT